MERKNRVSNDPKRDSNYEWLVQICLKLSKRHPIVFLPDYMSDTTISLDNVYTIRELADDITLRGALFEYSILTILPNGAGSALAHLNKRTKYLNTGITRGSKIFNENWFRRNGFKKDINPFCEDSSNQVWRWEELTPDETFDIAIATETEIMQ